MSRKLVRFLVDHEREGDRLVAVCRACHRMSPLNLKTLIATKGPMLTLPELAKSLRCRNCRKKVAEVRIVNGHRRPPLR
jgi:hypothetical protein